MAVVAESPDDRSVVFRTYCSQWPVDGRRHVRPPILKPGAARPGDVVGRYQAALDAGDADAIVSTFAPDGYFREPIGPHSTHRGTAELRSFFTRCFSAGGGIGLQHCVVTDDGVRCALEYNCVRWGSHDLPPQAGIGVYERGPDGLLAAARVYDDVEAPVEQWLRAVRHAGSGSVAGDLAAVDVQDLAGDERRRLQEEDAVDDVADLAHAPERVEPGERVVGLRRVLRRLDDARRDGVDPDAAGRRTRWPVTWWPRRGRPWSARSGRRASLELA